MELPAARESGKHVHITEPLRQVSDDALGRKQPIELGVLIVLVEYEVLHSVLHDTMTSEDPDDQVVDRGRLVRSCLEPVRDDAELLHKLRMTWVIRERVDALLGFDTVRAQGLLDVKAVAL